MIAARELRIGNYTMSMGEIYGKPMISKVCGVQKNDNIWGIGVNWKGETMNHYPIPLTEDWLIKLGFKKSISVNWNLSIGDFDMRLAVFPEQVTLLFVTDRELGDTNRSVLLNHNVHSLQNLVFALTGKELTYKE